MNLGADTAETDSRRADVAATEPLDRVERVVPANPSLNGWTLGYRRKSRVVKKGSTRCPVAVAPFGPARLYVVAPSLNPVIHCAP